MAAALRSVVSQGNESIGATRSITLDHTKETDRRSITQSVKESREHLDEVIHAWSKVISVEQLFRGIDDRAKSLPEAERQQSFDRLRRARDFVGTQNPLDYFLTWKTPLERYAPLSLRTPNPYIGDVND